MNYKEEKKLKGLYVHVPFCVSKCKYCDFLSYNKCGSEVKKFLEGLKYELMFYKESYAGEMKFDTIYIGGGTPTSLGVRELEKLIQIIFSNVCTSPSPELTIEANPNNLEVEKIALISAYFNRLSLGLQSTSNYLLKILGRTHNYKDFLKTYELVSRYFDNINVDLIYGVPKETIEEFEQDIRKVLALSPQHVSIYGLSIEPGTKLYEEVEEDFKLEPPSEQAQNFMYFKAREMLLAAGFEHYELSNFSFPGYKSIHNLNYWKRGKYLGLGPGAHSFWNRKRWKNPADINKYLDRSVKTNKEKSNYLAEDIIEIDFYDALAEYFFLGLRLTDGIELKKLGEEFNLNLFEYYSDEIEYLVEEGLLKIVGDRLSLTTTGYTLANRVFMEFLPSLDK